MKGIRKIDYDLAIPSIELLRNIVMSSKWDGKEDEVSLRSMLNGLGNDAGSEFVRQRRERLRTTGVCDCDFDMLACKDACERGTNLAGTNNGVLHEGSPVSQRALSVDRGI